MTSVDVKNNLVISKIAKKSFGLADKYFEIFKERLLYERPIAKEFAHLVGKDLRYRIKATDSMLECMDESFAKFKDIFPFFCEEYNLSYSEYKNNKIKVKKNDIKISKELQSFYFNKYKLAFSEYITEYFSMIQDSNLYKREILIGRIFDREIDECFNGVSLSKSYSRLFYENASLSSFNKEKRSFKRALSYIDDFFSGRNFFLDGISSQEIFDSLNGTYHETARDFFGTRYAHIDLKESYFFNILMLSIIFNVFDRQQVKNVVSVFIKRENNDLIERFLDNLYLLCSSNSSSLEEFIKSSISEKLVQITNKKTFSSTKEYEFVLSLNYADWFLSSTGEEWESCISLFSEYEACYWMGLPTMIGDKSRALVYITEKGNKKDYRGIVVDSISVRSWIFVARNKDDNNKIGIWYVKSYPNPQINLKQIVSDVTGLPVFTPSTEGSRNNKIISRYYSENLWFKKDDNGDYNFTTIYLDNHSYKISKKNKSKFFPKDYGYFVFNDTCEAFRRSTPNFSDNNNFSSFKMELPFHFDAIIKDEKDIAYAINYYINYHEDYYEDEDDYYEDEDAM